MKIVNLGWGAAQDRDILAVLNSVHAVFEPCFGQTMNKKEPIICYRDEGPMVLNKDSIIFLSVKGLYWSQFAYQFAHEYCHFQIGREVPQQMRWFEESICELASYFFLPRIAERWTISPPYTNWRSYAPNFVSYVENDRRKATPIDLDFSTETETLIHLMKDEYDRAKNAYVAITLEPIFQEDPTLWSSIPYIADIPNGLSFPESLLYWYNLCSDIHRVSIEKIARAFSIEIPQ